MLLQVLVVLGRTTTAHLPLSLADSNPPLVAKKNPLSSSQLAPLLRFAKTLEPSSERSLADTLSLYLVRYTAPSRVRRSPSLSPLSVPLRLAAAEEKGT